jgi:hypothetical protein
MIHKSQKGMLTPQQICQRMQNPLAIKPYTPKNAWGLYLVTQHAKALRWWSEYLQIDFNKKTSGGPTYGWTWEPITWVVNQHLNLVDYELCNNQNRELLHKIFRRGYHRTTFTFDTFVGALNWARLLDKRPDFAQFVNPYTSMVILYQQDFFLDFLEGRILIDGPHEYREEYPYKLSKLDADFDESLFDLYPYDDEGGNI